MNMDFFFYPKDDSKGKKENRNSREGNKDVHGAGYE